MTDTSVAQLQQLLNRQRQVFYTNSDPSHALRMDRQARRTGGTLLHPPYGKTFEWVLGLIRRLR